ncbi:phage tail protein [Aeromonas salmonicida]|uniref:phage tail-collar fiber domain-containing protein n=1 Tax=Aeromonas salmonicida TaxID=645 RepID=UPI00223EA80A|nr:phage tail protein [Aeromonas salmonicida]
MSQVITNAFEQYWQSCLAAEQPVVLDEFILADIPNLDITSPIDPETGLPPESQIVHRQNVDQRGRINNNAVAYTIVMDTTVGDFSFNAMYLRNKANGVIGMIVYKGRETKLKTDQTTGQTGNSLVKSMLMGYDQAAEATLTHVDAGTWQIDYAARLRGMDEDIRQLQADLYGHHTFVGDGFKVVEQDGAYQVTKGVAIVGGLRVELKAPKVIHPGTKPIGVWVDVHRAGSLLSEHQNHFTIITSVADLADHVDSNGYQHYVAKLGTILADSTIEDGRGSAGGGSGGAGSIPDTFALWKRSMAEAGYDLIGKFGVKHTINKAEQVLLSEDGSAVFSWGGDFPKIVGSDETPNDETSLWIDKTKSLLKDELLKFNGFLVANTKYQDVPSHGSGALGEALDKQALALLSNVNQVKKDIAVVKNNYDPVVPHGAPMHHGRAASIAFGAEYKMRAAEFAKVYDGNGFLCGQLTGLGAPNYAASEISDGVVGYCCQGRVYWDGTQDSAYIGYNVSAFGDGNANKHLSIGFRAGLGFVINNSKEIKTIVPASMLSQGWYELTFFYTRGGWHIASLQKEGGVKAKSTIIKESLPIPVNAQCCVFSASDKIRDFRFIASTTDAVFCHCPYASRAFHTPLRFPSSSEVVASQLSKGVVVHLPAGYDDRITHRLAVYCHGAGGEGADLWDYDNENSVLLALLNAGYVVCAVDYDEQGWGGNSSINQNAEGIRFVMSKYNVFDKIYLVVQSMGGLVGLNGLLRGDFDVAAVAGIYPASNLRWCYEHGFKNEIEGAYGFSGVGEFEAATAGHDIVNDNYDFDFSLSKFKFWHSKSDTVVSKADNTDLLAKKVSDGGGEFVVVETLGEHGDKSSFRGSEIVDFFGGR